MADKLKADGDERLVTSQEERHPSARRGPWTRRLLTIGIALAALGGFGAIVFTAYDRGRQSADPSGAPVIRADGGPTKIRPQQPGGMDVPNQDKQIYGRIAPIEAPGSVERLIPPPQATVSRPPPLPPAQPAVAPPPAAPATTAETARAQSVEPAAPASPPVAAAPPPPPPVKTTPPAPVRSAAAPSPAVRALTGGYRIQIASLRSEDAARRQWVELTRRNGDLFGKLQSTVLRIDLGDKGVYWRLQAGPLSDAAAAQALCDRARQRKIGCIVVRP